MTRRDKAPATASRIRSGPRTRFNQFTAVLLLAVVAMCVVACQPPPPRTPEVFWTWDQKTNPQLIWLLPASSGFCYLTRISGDFSTQAEAVHLGVAQNPANNQLYWELNGVSDTKDVTATAGCSYWTNFNFTNFSSVTQPWTAAAAYYVPAVPPINILPECCANGPEGCTHANGFPYNSCEPIGGANAYWQDGVAGATLSQTNSFCYLTGIVGELNSSQESVTIVPNLSSTTANIYNVRVQSGVHNETLFGSGGCVNYNPTHVPDQRISTYTWSQGNPQFPGLISGADGICFLSGIGGKFRGDKEWVEIDHDTIPVSNVPMRLSGHSDQNSVFGNATCVRYDVHYWSWHGPLH